jgi:hypothetical protein
LRQEGLRLLGQVVVTPELGHHQPGRKIGLGREPRIARDPGIALIRHELDLSTILAECQSFPTANVPSC